MGIFATRPGGHAAREPVKEKALHALARAPAWLYGWGVRLRERAYDRGYFETVRLPIPVICLGNLTVGGSGKTPGVLWLVEQLLKAGHRPAVITRGYGREDLSSVQTQTPGQAIADPRELTRRLGDEPTLVVRRFPSVPLVAAADRSLAARLAWETFSPDCLIMDDGFQHRRLWRDRDVVCFDAQAFRQAFVTREPCLLLPAGPWRESPTRVSRAHLIFVTKVDESPESSLEIPTEIPEAPGVPVVRVPSRYRLWERFLQQEKPLGELKGLSVLAFSALAKPRYFEGALERLGARVSARRFPDHHFFTSEDIQSLLRESQEKGQPLLTTEKDAQRLPPDFPAWVLSMEWDLPSEALWMTCVFSVFG